jgi:hypothetical protein
MATALGLPSLARHAIFGVLREAERDGRATNTVSAPGHNVPVEYKRATLPLVPVLVDAIVPTPVVTDTCRTRGRPTFPAAGRCSVMSVQR